MLSTPFEHQIYLGFSSQEQLQQPSFQSTFLGGTPIFLRQPQAKQLMCSECTNQSLTFICQIFCPLQMDHCYNRVLYIFFCEACQFEFRCFKQQSGKEEMKIVKSEVKTIKQERIQIGSQAFDLKDLTKIRSNAKRDVEEEIIEQVEEDQFEEEEMEIKQIQINFDKLNISKGELQKQIGEEKLSGLKTMTEKEQQTKKQEKDPIFQQYRKVMKALQGPILLYSNIPIPYNTQPINPQHFCQYCKAKLSLQLQLTEKMLLVSPKLVNLDWGSLFVFTCSSSCSKSIEECVVVQYETDAIKDSQISVLKKRQKNRKRKEKNKEKKERSQEKEKVQIVQENELGQDEEGDWD